MTRWGSRVIASALLLLGCDASGGCSTIGLWAPPKEDPRGAQVERARLAWNAITRSGHQILPERGWRGWEVDFVAHVHCEAATGKCSGYTDEDKQIVQIDASLTPEQVYPVVLHELGHVVGLRHTCDNPIVPSHQTAPGAPPCGPASLGVMDGAHITVNFTSFDMDECRRVDACW